MQIMIDISEDLYKATINGLNAEEIWDLRVAIKNGTPLPKGHGDLIDRKELLKKPMDTANYPSNYVRIADAIIEEDKEYEAEVITRGNCMMCGKELTDGLFFCKECGDKIESENDNGKSRSNLSVS